MDKKELSQLEDIFLDWHVSLGRGPQAHIEYGHYDEDLNIMFIKRTESFNRALLKDLQEEVAAFKSNVRVSTLVYPHLG